MNDWLRGSAIPLDLDEQNFRVVCALLRANDLHSIKAGGIGIWQRWQQPVGAKEECDAALLDNLRLGLQIADENKKGGRLDSQQGVLERDRELFGVDRRLCIRSSEQKD